MIHTYEQAGYHILVDTAGGGVFILDELTHKIVDLLTPPLADECPQSVLDALPEYAEQDIRDGYADLLELYRDGQLFVEDDYEKYVGLIASSPVKSMCLNIAHDCNLRCKYCFASTGDFGGGRKLMPLETAKAAIDFLVEQSKGRRNLEVDFFGGEPLMNFDVVKQTVEYARSIEKKFDKNFRFTMTTNGILLDDEKIDFINREMYNLVLSIDGRPEVNDRMRPTANGKGSYDIIMPNFRRALEKRDYQNYYIRATFTKNNLDFSRDFDHFVAEGFDQISIEPVVSDPSCPWAITEEDLPAIYAEYDRLAQRVLELKKAGKQVNFFHFMVDMGQGPCAIKRLKGCGCGNEYVAVTPEGDIYPCHQFVGQDGWKMGNVQDGTFDFARKADFATANIYNKPACKDCWARFFCSGGCNANNAEHCGSIFNAYPITCALERKRVECALMIKVALAGEEAE